MCLCKTKWYLWIFSFFSIDAFQNTVNIMRPCNSEHQYILGHGDSLYMEASGWTEETCPASLVAAEGCSRICITIESYAFNWCTMSLNIYDSNVWDFHSVNPSVRRGCSREDKVGGRVWCSSGKSATVRLEPETQHREQDSNFEARLYVRADCGLPPKPSPTQADMSQTMVLTRMIFIGIIVGAVFGGILVTSVCFSIIYCVCLKKRNRQDGSSNEQSYISVPMQPTAPPSESLRLHAHFHCTPQSPISNPTYQQPKGSIIEIKSIHPPVKH